MRISWTEGASKNLDEIEAYIGDDDPGKAVDVILSIIHMVEHLSCHSELGRSGRVEGTRELVMPAVPYIIVYRVVSATIQVLRVLHMSTDYPNNF